MKKFFLIMLCGILVLCLASCSKNRSDEPETPETRVLSGTIKEFSGSTMLVVPEEGSWELGSSDLFSIPIQHMETSIEPLVGDKLEILYSGGILETYPASLENILSIRVIKSETQPEENPKEETESKCRAVFAFGEVYWETAYEGEPIAENGTFIGLTILEGIPEELKDIEFEEGLRYQGIGKEGWITVEMPDGKCILFATNEARASEIPKPAGPDETADEPVDSPIIAPGDPKAPEGFSKPEPEPSEDVPETTQPYFITLFVYVHEIAPDGSMACAVPKKPGQSTLYDYVYLEKTTDGTTPECGDTLKITYQGELTPPKAMEKLSGKECAGFETLLSAELHGVSGKK